MTRPYHLRVKNESLFERIGKSLEKNGAQVILRRLLQKNIAPLPEESGIRLIIG